jgi:ParB family chromosome partitioning protein
MKELTQEVIPLSKIIINERARKNLGDLSELMSSIKEFGLLHPVVVSSNYHLLAGGRRLEACKRLNWINITVSIFKLETEVEHLEIELLENIQRKDFTWQEQSLLTKKINDFYTAKNPDTWSGRKTAKLMGRGVSSVSRDIALAEKLQEIPEFKNITTAEEAGQILKAAICSGGEENLSSTSLELVKRIKEINAKKENSSINHTLALTVNRLKNSIYPLDGQSRLPGKEYDFLLDLTGSVEFEKREFLFKSLKANGSVVLLKVRSEEFSSTVQKLSKLNLTVIQPPLVQPSILIDKSSNPIHTGYEMFILAYTGAGGLFNFDLKSNFFPSSGLVRTLLTKFTQVDGRKVILYGIIPDSTYGILSKLPATFVCFSKHPSELFTEELRVNQLKIISPKRN